MNSVHTYWSKQVYDITQKEYDAVYAFMLHHPAGVLEERVASYPIGTVGYTVALDVLNNSKSYQALGQLEDGWEQLNQQAEDEGAYIATHLSRGEFNKDFINNHPFIKDNKLEL